MTNSIHTGDAVPLLASEWGWLRYVTVEPKMATATFFSPPLSNLEKAA
jgi:hypothetical protein